MSVDTDAGYNGGYVPGDDYWRTMQPEDLEAPRQPDEPPFPAPDAAPEADDTATPEVRDLGEMAADAAGVETFLGDENLPPVPEAPPAEGAPDGWLDVSPLAVGDVPVRAIERTSGPAGEDGGTSQADVTQPRSRGAAQMDGDEQPGEQPPVVSANGAAEPDPANTASAQAENASTAADILAQIRATARRAAENAVQKIDDETRREMQRVREAGDHEMQEVREEMEVEDRHLAQVAEAQEDLLNAGMDPTWVDTEGEVRREAAWFENHPEAFTQLEQARQHDADAQAKESDAKAMADNVTHEQRAIAAINEAIALEVAAGELHDETAAHYAAAPRVWQTKQEKLQQEADALRLKAAETRAAIMREIGYATGNLEEPSEEE